MVQFNADTIQPNVYLHLDSKNCSTSISSSNKTFKLNNAIETIGEHKIIVSLWDAIIPHSFYNITSLNNTFIYYTGLDISTQKTYTITPGYYTINQIISLIETHLKSSDGYNDANCSVVIEDYTNKIKITVPSGSTIVIQGTGLINNILGIEEKGGASQTQTATNVYNANPTTHLKIKLINLQNQNLDSQGKREDTLCRIPVNNIFGNWIHFHDTGSRHNVLEQNFINQIQVLIQDEDGNDIDFNGLDWKLTLSFHFIKKRQHQFKSLREQLNFTTEN